MDLNSGKLFRGDDLESRFVCAVLFFLFGKLSKRDLGWSQRAPITIRIDKKMSRKLETHRNEVGWRGGKYKPREGGNHKPRGGSNRHNPIANKWSS